MFKRVDIEEDNLDGFQYYNKDGEPEYVKIDVRDFTQFLIQNSAGDVVSIYTKDIPKLIKALKAVEDYWKAQK